MPTIYILAGPTASGKTAFAIRFALQNNCEILSCDASAFYRGMNIGTAKPTQEERAQVPHWGIDIADPRRAFSIKEYVDYTQGVVSDITSRNKNVMVVGGSGFYLKSFLTPMVDAVTPDHNVTQKIEDLEKKCGIEALIHELKRLSPQIPAHLDLSNPRKVKKALERCILTGRSLLEIEEQFLSMPKPFPDLTKKCFLLQPSLEILKLRIRLRVKNMLQEGLIEEVRTLLKQDLLQPGTPAALAIGYRETLDFIQNSQISIQALEAQIIKNTYALAKKQTTWFRHQMFFDRFIY